MKQHWIIAGVGLWGAAVLAPAWAATAPSPPPPPTPPAAANAVAADDTSDDDSDDSDDDDDDDAALSNPAGDPEAETAQSGDQPLDSTLRYTTDLGDAEVERRFLHDLPALGSVSVGFADSGRLINGVRLGTDDAWQLVVPEYCYGTQETVDFLSLAARAVHARYPDVAPLRINHIGKKDGGYLRPHRSHQSGRDADLGFYYKGNLGPGGARGRRELLMDPGPNWLLLRTLIAQTDVQLILTDRRVQKVLYDYALAQGEDKAWLDSLFHAGKSALFQHARHHRDHFHVRFFAARSQELGRRIQPLLAKRPDENLMSYKVKKGDTLGQLAHRYGSTVAMIQHANHMKNSFLHLGHPLLVPMRGPCTQCPQPVPLVLPPRRVPPTELADAKAAAPPPAPVAVTAPASVAAPVAPAAEPMLHSRTAALGEVCGAGRVMLGP